MGDMTASQILGLLNSGGILALLVIIIMAGKNKVWCWGYQLREAEIKAARWEELFLRVMNVSEAIVTRNAPKGTDT